MWQPCYLATAECYSEIIDFTQSSDLVSDCIHSCRNIPYVRCSSVQSGPAPAASSGQPGRAITGSHYSMQLSSLSFCTHLSNALAASITSSAATVTPLWPSWESTHGFPRCAVERVDHVDLFMYGRYSKNYFSLDKELSLIIGPDRKTFELTLRPWSHFQWITV